MVIATSVTKTITADVHTAMAKRPTPRYHHKAPSEVRQILEENGLAAKKSWGQNFLVDDHAINCLVQSASEYELPIIEIGAGLGAITRPLAATGLPIFPIERDRELIPLLQKALTGENVHLIEGNALTIDLGALVPEPDRYVLVGNIPYHLTAPLFMRLFANVGRAARMVVMVQREVAQRFVAPPRSSERSSLAVWADLAGQAKLLMELSPASFSPQPHVYSTIIQLDVDSTGPLSKYPFKLVEELLRAAFHQRRKTLKNSLSILPLDPAVLLDNAGIDQKRRPEELDREEWIRLIEAYSQMTDFLTK